MKKRIFSVLMAIVMVVSLLPTAVFAAETTYNVWVGGTQVTSDNMNNVVGDGTVSFTPANGGTPATLTLNNANISVSGNGINAIKSDIDLTIMLEGTNSVSADSATAIYSNTEDFTISGTGSLTATGDGTGNGIHSENGYVTISGGTVTATGGVSGIRAYYVRINGGTVVATGTEDGIRAFGTYANIQISGGIVTATGGNNGISASGSNANSTVTISGGDVTAEGTSKYGIHGGNTTFRIQGGTVTAKGGTHALHGSAYFPDETTHRRIASVNMSGSPEEAYTSDKYSQYKYIKFEPKPTYAITLEDVGGVTTGGSYGVDKTAAADGVTVTVAASPNANYVVDTIEVYKTGDENTTVTVTDGSFTMPAYPVTVSVTFQSITYTCTVTANPTAGGTVTGGGTYAPGASVTLTATPNEGYSFLSWEKGGETVSDVASYTFTSTETAEYVANFVKVYNIKIQQGTAGPHLITGGDLAALEGSTHTVRATPAAGYSFVNWTENDEEVSTSASYTFTVERNRTLTANFEAIPYTVTVDDPTNGSATVDKTDVTVGEIITITATPAEEYLVDAITVYKTGDPGTTVTVTNNKFTMPAYSVTVSVTFKENVPHDITLQDANGVTEGGSYSVNKTSTKAGETVTITVTPDDGYVAIVSAYGMPGGYSLGVTRVDDNTYTFEMPSDQVRVDVAFYMPVLSVNCGGDTFYTDDLEEAFDVADDLSDEYSGAPVTIKVLQDYVEDGSASSFYNCVPVTLDLNGHHIYFENTFWGIQPMSFDAQNYQDKVGSIWITQDDEYGKLSLTDSSAGKTGFVHAMLEVMYGTLRVDSGTYYGLVFPANTKISGGTFLGMPQEIINNDPTGLYEEWIGSISAFPASVYWPSYDEEESARAAMEGIVAEGYVATNEVVVSESPSGYWLAGLPANTSVVEDRTITVTANPAEGGTVAGSGNYADGETVTLTATPNSGYRFVNWTESGTEVSTDATYTFTAEADCTLVANFARNSSGRPSGSSKPTYTVTAEQTDNGKVEMNRGNAAAGGTVTVTAVPEEGYVLKGLTVTDSKGNAIEVTDKGDGTYTFQMPDGKVDVQAEFVKEGSYSVCTGDHDCTMHSYTDLNSKAWYHDGVHYCIEKGLMSGYGDGVFEPDAETTRGMIAVMLWRLSGSPVVDYRLDFEDVEEGQWYTEAIRWAKAEGIADGYGNGSFGANDAVTREQMVAILWRYAQHKAYDVSIGEHTNILSYGDASAVAEYAISAMQWACGSGVVTGKDNATGTGLILDPAGKGTRAQIATMMMNFCEGIEG